MIDINIVINIIRLLIGIIILSYASYTDIKTRRASNYLWLIMGIIGGILLVIQYFHPDVGIENTMYLLFIPIMIGLMYVLFQLGLIFGGADAKALMALAILVPIEPTISSFPLWKSFMPYPWVIFSNSVIIFLFIPISLLIYNLVKRNFGFPYSFVGYRMKITKAKEKFVWPLEKIIDGKRKFMYMPKDFDIKEELNEFEKLGIEEIWVTPKVPFMIPLLVGFICTFILGDILTHLMNCII